MKHADCRRGHKLELSKYSKDIIWILYEINKAQLLVFMSNFSIKNYFLALVANEMPFCGNHCRVSSGL